MEARWKYKPFVSQFQAKLALPVQDSAVFLNPGFFRCKYWYFNHFAPAGIYAL